MGTTGNPAASTARFQFLPLGARLRRWPIGSLDTLSSWDDDM